MNGFKMNRRNQSDGSSARSTRVTRPRTTDQGPRTAGWRTQWIVLWLAINGITTHLAANPTDIGTRRELFVDDALIGALSGGARLELHEPVPREVVLEHDAPWEGTGTGYHSVFQDGGKYRMYYKAWHIEVKDGKVNTGSHPLFCCYAESDDGLTWRKPELGLVEFQGSKANNIVLAPETLGTVKSDPGHPAVFKDENPACPPEARYKAIIRSEKPHGLLLFQSPDGLRWSLAHPEPVITEGAFDSQNLAFYDPNIQAIGPTGVSSPAARPMGKLEAFRQSRHPHRRLEGPRPLAASRGPPLRRFAGRATLHERGETLPPGPASADRFSDALHRARLV